MFLYYQLIYVYQQIAKGFKPFVAMNAPYIVADWVSKSVKGQSSSNNASGLLGNRLHTSGPLEKRTLRQMNPQTVPLAGILWVKSQRNYRCAS